MNTPGHPASLRVVAGLFVFAGVCAAIEIIVSLFCGRLSLNLSMLGLWIGPGLLRHDRTWRTWALVFLWFGLIGLPLFCLLALGHAPLKFKLFGIVLGKVPPVFGLAMAAVIFPIILWQYRVLTRPDIRQLFTDGLDGHVHQAGGGK